MKNTARKKEKLEILYIDEYLCVINKPSGLLSVPYPASHTKTALSLLEEIMHKNGTWKAGHRPFAVHRLDRDTSGVMVFALSEKVQKKMMDSWHTCVTQRLYRAVAENPKNESLFLSDSGLIDDNLAFNAHNQGFVPKKTDSAEKNAELKTVPARTNYKILFRGKTHTLFELSLDTGKKNQIRAHLASKGYPLAGDENYRARTDNFGRLCLHAATLEFIHPYTEKTLKFEVKEPETWLEYVKKGDFHPETPVWIKELHEKFENTKGEHFHSRGHGNTENFPPEKRLSRKQTSKKYFIEAGKKRGR